MPNYFSKNFLKRVLDKTGQSLIELLLAVVVGMIFIGVAIAVIAPALRTNTKTNEAKIGAALGRELFENLRVFGEGNWHNIDTLATGSNNIFYLTSTTPFATSLVTSTGAESIMITTTTYTRFFYLEDICRDQNGAVVSSSPPCVGGVVDDPSTKKVVVVFKWPQSATHTFYTYLTRYRSKISNQTNWSLGPGQAGPVLDTAEGFITSTNINFSSSTGSFRILDIYQ